MNSDPASYIFALASDSRSHGTYLKVMRVKPEPWALAAQSVQASTFVGKRLRVTVAVNAEELEGGAGPMILLQGAGGRVLGERKVLQKRSAGWQRVGAEIDVPPGTEVVEVGLILEGGGAVGFDDVEVAALAPARP
jgi:hypothetical protein